jgi:predicted amidophosphoribosyltransferase
LHALRCRGYTRLVERVAAPLMLGFNQAKLLARRINALVSDTLQVVRSTRDQVEPSAAGRRANVAGAYSARGPVVG